MTHVNSPTARYPSRAPYFSNFCEAIPAAMAVEEQDVCFVVKDNGGPKLAYVRSIAANVAKLPDPLRSGLARKR